MPVGRAHPAPGRGRLGAFHLFSPGGDADRLKLALHRRHDHPDVLDYRGGFFAIIPFMAYCVYRFRHKEGSRAAYNPENKKLEWWLSVGTTVGVAALLGPGLLSGTSTSRFPKECDRGRGRGTAVAYGAFGFRERTAGLALTDARIVGPDNPWV